MGLIRLVIQKPEGKPFANLGVTLRRTEPAEPKSSPDSQGMTDGEGVVRFRIEPGTFKVQLIALPERLQPPKYGTTVRLEDFAEGIEQIIRLVKVG